MLTLESDNIITHVLTDADGDGVIGATVTGLIQDAAGTQITTFTMNDDGAGVYSVVIADDALADLENNHRYTIVITSVSDGYTLKTYHSELARYQTG